MFYLILDFEGCDFSRSDLHLRSGPRNIYYTSTSPFQNPASVQFATRAYRLIYISRLRLCHGSPNLHPSVFNEKVQTLALFTISPLVRRINPVSPRNMAPDLHI